MRRAYAKRRDENEPDIIAAIQRRGLKVVALDPPLPDLLAESVGGSLVMLEVKSLTAKRGGNQNRDLLTPTQVAFHLKWRKHVHIVKTPDEALRVLGVV